MVLGDQQAVPAGAVDDMRRSGLLHILAVSGENVVLLCTMGSFVLTLARVRRDLRSFILIPSVILYVVVTGATPSIVRAGVSGVVALLAGLSSRASDGWFLWLVPAAFMLTRSPAVLFDVSFQLSFAAVAGLLLLARPLTHALAVLPRWLGEPAAITTAASLSTAPVSVATFGQTSLVAVPANIAGGFVLGPDHVPRHAQRVRRLRLSRPVGAAQRRGRSVHRLSAHRGRLVRPPLVCRLPVAGPVARVPRRRALRRARWSPPPASPTAPACPCASTPAGAGGAAVSRSWPSCCWRWRWRWRRRARRRPPGPPSPC